MELKNLTKFANPVGGRILQLKKIHTYVLVVKKD